MKTEIQNESKQFNHRGGQAANKGLYASYIEVNSIKNTNNEVFGNNEHVGRAELNQIAQLADRPDIFPLLVKSACPSIYGNDIVKAGLILSLFGGTDY